MKKHQVNLAKLSLKKLSIAVLNSETATGVNGGATGTTCNSVYQACITPSEFITCRTCDRLTRARSCEACIPETEYVSCYCEPM